MMRCIGKKVNEKENEFKSWECRAKIFYVGFAFKVMRYSGINQTTP